MVAQNHFLKRLTLSPPSPGTNSIHNYKKIKKNFLNENNLKKNLRSERLTVSCLVVEGGVADECLCVYVTHSVQEESVVVVVVVVVL